MLKEAKPLDVSAKRYEPRLKIRKKVMKNQIGLWDC